MPTQRRRPKHLRPVSDPPKRSVGRPRGDTYDWGTDRGYDITHFYTGSTDTKGHDLRIQVRVPPSLAGRVSALVESRVVPHYRTSSDVFRDGAMHRLVWVAENVVKDAKLAAELQRYAAMSRLESMLDTEVQLQESVEKMVEQIRLLGRSAPPARLKVKLRAFADQAEQFPDEYRDRVMSEIDYWAKG